MKIENLSELQLYINMLNKKYDKYLTKYDEIIKLLKEEFNIDTNNRQLDLLFSPTVEEDLLDLEQLYKNILW